MDHLLQVTDQIYQTESSSSCTIPNQQPLIIAAAKITEAQSAEELGMIFSEADVVFI